VNASAPIPRRPEEPPRLHERALDQLTFIRDTMEGASRFTAVPGRGIVLIGLTALAAAWIASRRATVEGWILTWLGEAVSALAIGVVTAAVKARAAGVALLSAPGRKAALAFAPPLLAGAVLTAALYRAGRPDLLPGSWLLLYGTGMVTGGAFSVRVIPVMGLGFVLAGAATLLGPASWGGPAMAAGFGGLHLLFGLLIWREHGG
jgi:hypothetical protein